MVSVVSYCLQLQFEIIGVMVMVTVHVIVLWVKIIRIYNEMWVLTRLAYDALFVIKHILFLRLPSFKGPHMQASIFNVSQSTHHAQS